MSRSRSFTCSHLQLVCLQATAKRESHTSVGIHVRVRGLSWRGVSIAGNWASHAALSGQVRCGSAVRWTEGESGRIQRLQFIQWLLISYEAVHRWVQKAYDPRSTGKGKRGVKCAVDTKTRTLLVNLGTRYFFEDFHSNSRCARTRASCVRKPDIQTSSQIEMARHRESGHMGVWSFQVEPINWPETHPIKALGIRRAF